MFCLQVIRMSVLLQLLHIHYRFNGPGGSDSDSVTVKVNQIPQISYNAPNNINYGDTLSIPITYRYVTNGVTINAIYTQRNPNTGNTVNTTQTISLMEQTQMSLADQ